MLVEERKINVRDICSLLCLVFAEKVSDDHLLHGSCDLFVPEGINDGVQEWEYDSMEDRDHLVRSILIKRSGIDIDCRTKHENDNNDVGIASGERLAG